MRAGRSLHSVGRRRRRRKVAGGLARLTCATFAGRVGRVSSEYFLSNICWEYLGLSGNIWKYLDFEPVRERLQSRYKVSLTVVLNRGWSSIRPKAEIQWEPVWVLGRGVSKQYFGHFFTQFTSICEELLELISDANMMLWEWSPFALITWPQCRSHEGWSQASQKGLKPKIQTLIHDKLEIEEMEGWLQLLKREREIADQGRKWPLENNSWKWGCSEIQGVFFTGPPPKKLKYGKQRLGEVRCI